MTTSPAWTRPATAWVRRLQRLEGVLAEVPREGRGVLGWERCSACPVSCGVLLGAPAAHNPPLARLVPLEQVLPCMLPHSPAVPAGGYVQSCATNTFCDPAADGSDNPCKAVAPTQPACPQPDYACVNYKRVGRARPGQQGMPGHSLAGACCSRSPASRSSPPLITMPCGSASCVSGHPSTAGPPRSHFPRPLLSPSQPVLRRQHRL